MKLRFSLRVLLAIILVIGCAISWCTWPDRTFNAFKASLKNDRLALANSIVQNSVSTFSDGIERPCTFVADTAGIHLKCAGNGSSTPKPQYFFSQLVSENRSFGDILKAKRVYTVRGLTRDTGTQRFAFVVQRGKITLEFNYGK